MASARSLHTFNRGKQLNCILHAGLSICRTPQVPVVDQYAVQKLSQQENKQENTPKTTKQKQQSKNSKTKNTQPKQKPNKNDREGIATSNGNYMQDDILCVIQRMAQNKNQTKNTPKGHVGG